MKVGVCVAGGSYQTKSGLVEPMVEVFSRAHWSAPQRLQLPKNAPKQPYGEVNGLACAEWVQTCTAVGDFVHDSSGDLQAFLDTEFLGHWSGTFLPELPANSAINENASLSAVACTHDGWCQAVGRYVDRSGHVQAMAITKPKGRNWGSATELMAPLGAAANPHVSLTGLACTTRGACVAVGTYITRGNQVQPMGLVEDRYTWRRAVRVAAPANGAHNGFAALRSVSCSSGAPCVAVGEYALTSAAADNAATDNRAMSVTEVGGRFGPATGITTVPAGAGTTPTTDLSGVSCTGPHACVAVGVGTNSAGHSVAMYAVQAHGRWTESFLLPPSDAGTGSRAGSSLFSVACPDVGHCVTVGYYNDNSGGYRAEAALTKVPASPSRTSTAQRGRGQQPSSGGQRQGLTSPLHHGGGQVHQGRTGPATGSPSH
ncbi:MAG TPA: hypothetical protein VGS19_02240 [Streptosporangiaceae bacterium]|nr:hypothetical protein [Streptosporangiaceae bacterium]